MKISFTIILFLFVLTGCAQNSPYPKRDFKPCYEPGACITLLRNAISNNWSCSEIAYRGLEVIVTANLDENTNLLSVDISTSSGSPSLDKSALDAVNKTAPFVELKGLNENVYEKVFRRFNFHFRPIDSSRSQSS